ncbi:hypothetical protein [Bifidobacterium sp. ESL0790]|uniref:hypothetical protein n=1 Tax=Bifidobacterium sp. ESL0790 TaxID=2983233 RepID=UPI0023F9C4CB|nr:hypothetical protein [Bifidobacterium sp. ESL0790]WEV72108.1 hypothetical protein OZY47_06620 [Bifidobacterium sp. ESL0790]
MPDKVKVTGTIPQGSGIYALQNGDKVEAALMPKNDPSSTTPTVGTAAAANDVTLDTSTGTWSATFPLSALVGEDDVGQGLSYVFRARLVTTSDGDSSYAFSAGKQADLVAPTITDAKFNKGARTVTGVVWSGDATNQSNRVKETKFSVTVTWPAGSSTSSTTLTCTSGAASISGATCPTSGSGDGIFTLPVPSGVLLKGDAQMRAKDSPAASEPTLVGSGEPNVSSVATFDSTMPVVTALPLTGGDAPSVWWRTWLLPVLAAAAVALNIRMWSKRRRARGL